MYPLIQLAEEKSAKADQYEECAGARSASSKAVGNRKTFRSTDIGMHARRTSLVAIVIASIELTMTQAARLFKPKSIPIAKPELVK